MKTTDLSSKKAKLENLKKLKSGVKKCKCGCDLIETKEKGGKVISKCSCGCGGVKTKKHEKGGIIDQEDFNALIDANTANKWERKMQSRKLRKFKEG